MQTTMYKPRVLVLGIALALGVAVAGAGCTPEYDDADTEVGIDEAAEPTAGMADSEQPVNDTWITSKVMAELATVEGLDNTDLGVETNNGVVTITGVAASDAAVQRAAAAAQRVDGVVRVDTMGLRAGGMDANGMAMNGDGETEDMDTEGSGQPVEDTWITTKVLAKLQTIENVDNTDIGVETKNGVVMLTGAADSQAEIDTAVAAAKTIQGVQSVDTSMMKIDPTEDELDANDANM